MRKCAQLLVALVTLGLLSGCSSTTGGSGGTYSSTISSKISLSSTSGYGDTTGKIVSYKSIEPGTIIINTSKRRLYYGVGEGKAIRYSVGVGRRGRQWTGTRQIVSKRRKPAWSPTKEILKDKPNITRVIPGGSPRNPMGEAALLLSGSGQYAIHGTNNPGSVGRFVSYGCIRMRNKDIMDLYSRVGYGTKVKVIR